ncbi:MAG: hypothetical protein GF401_17595 [Chitinivibrionales bacterium]|nr:hypothetical protein [Chitinivibrionales bacterium]
MKNKKTEEKVCNKRETGSGSSSETERDVSMEGSQDTIAHLSTALKTGFNILKILIVVLGIAFVLSNVSWVPEGFVAVHTRSGKIPENGNPVLHPGGPYFAFPQPIDNIIQIPTTIQSCIINKAFWIENESTNPDSFENDNRAVSEFLRPGEDGFLITADKNVVQGIWIVYYQVDSSPRNIPQEKRILSFLKNMGTLENAGSIIRTIAQEAILSVVAQTTVSDFVAGKIDNDAITERIQKKLNNLQAGIRVTNVSSSRYSVPRTLVKDFQAVNESESEKALNIEKAIRYRVSTLSEIAGEDWEVVLEEVTEFEQAAESGNQELEKRAYSSVEELMLSGAIGGTVAQQLDEARTWKTATIEESRASAERFNKLLPSYRKNPEIMKNQLFTDVLKQIWSSRTVSSLYVPSSKQLYLNLENDLGE